MQQAIRILAGPFCALTAGWLMWLHSGDFQMARMAGIAVWMAVWWILESVSLYLTALLPLVLFPLGGILSMRETAPLYTNEIIFLFTGGFLLAFTLEKWNLHKRLALALFRLTGTEARGVLLGCMLTAWLLSMWISNIAAVMMLLPAVRGIVESGLDTHQENLRKKVNTGILLGLAYSCSLGGISTLVGSAPNMIFLAFYQKHFPNEIPITFLGWATVAFPISAAMLVFCYYLLAWFFVPKGLRIRREESALSHNLEQGLSSSLSSNETKVLTHFILTVLLWCFREDMIFDTWYIPGWTNLLPWPEMVKDSTIAMGMAIVLLLTPDGKGSTLLTWQEVQKIPMGILFLFGGGFALAEGIEQSGLSDWMGQQLLGLTELSPWMVVILLAVFMTFFTEITSNTAATYLVLPIVLSLAGQVDLPPLILLMPVAISASMAFMLPVATPPNTVIFSTESIRIQDMARTGLILNIAGVMIITGIFYLYFWATS